MHYAHINGSLTTIKKVTLTAMPAIEWGFNTTGVSVARAFSDRINGKTSAWILQHNQ
jgi:hypothetical protein